MLLVMAVALSIAPTKPAEPPPIVRTNVAPPPVITETYPSWSYGSWRVTRYRNAAETFTANEAGSVLGVACSESNCILYVNNGATCKKGDEYPVLVNTSSGAYPETLKCMIFGEKPYLGMVLNKKWSGILMGGGQLGVALPMESGKFTISRFSLAGAADALAKLVTLVGDDGKRATDFEQ